MFTKDFWMHTFMCFVIAVIVGTFLAFTTIDNPLPAVLGAFLTSMGAGLGKEYGDSKAYGNSWSWNDILGDFLGAAVGSQIGWVALLINATL